MYNLWQPSGRVVAPHSYSLESSRPIYKGTKGRNHDLIQSRHNNSHLDSSTPIIPQEVFNNSLVLKDQEAYRLLNEGSQSKKARMTLLQDIYQQQINEK